jgi:predicted lipid-binding transport protein (Tim44 family)
MGNMTTTRNGIRNWLAGATAALVVGLSFALVVQDAEAARRLGGGKSFGRQTMNRDANPPAKAPAQNAANPSQQQSPAGGAPAAGNRWMGPLTGLAAGLGIAALLSHLGLGGAFAAALGNILVIALLIFAGLFLWRMLKRSTASASQGAPMRPAYQQSPGSARLQGDGASTNVFGAPIGGAPAAASPVPAIDDTNGIPADFDVEGFLRIAKVNFNRLQAAWDAGDLDDIRKFSTPEVYAEIKMQRDEEAGQSSRHEVENLEAQLLGIETTAEDYVASVRFSGSIREDAGNPEPFGEIWNLVKPVNGRTGWLLGGIQQLQ